MSKSTIALDLEDRDPNSISQHVQVSWDEVIGEPDDVRSPECAWRISNQIFNISKNFCYILLSVLCAPLTACCLGCMFACQSFEQIWCTNPGIRMCKVSFRGLKMFVMICSEAIIVPLMEAFGNFWSGIKIRNQTITEPPERKHDILIV